MMVTTPITVLLVPLVKEYSDYRFRIFNEKFGPKRALKQLKALK